MPFFDSFCDGDDSKFCCGLDTEAACARHTKAPKSCSWHTVDYCKDPAFNREYAPFIQCQRNGRGFCYTNSELIHKYHLNLWPEAVTSNFTAYWEADGANPIFLVNFLVTLVLANLGAVTIFFAVSVATSRVATANLICTLVTLYNMLMCGALAQKISMPMGASTWLFKLAVLNYAYEAMMINEYALVTPQWFNLGYKVSSSFTQVLPAQPGPTLIAQQGLCNITDCMFCPSVVPPKASTTNDVLPTCDLNFKSDIVALVIFPSVFLVVSYFILKFWVQESR